MRLLTDFWTRHVVGPDPTERPYRDPTPAVPAVPPVPPVPCVPLVLRAPEARLRARFAHAATWRRRAIPRPLGCTDRSTTPTYPTTPRSA